MRTRRSRRLVERSRKPRLTVAMILAWADDYQRRNSEWPHHFSGRIKGIMDETWSGVNDALARGRRGLPGRETLAKILYRHRGVQSPRNVPSLDEAQIVRWARGHFRRTAKWPTLASGRVGDAPGETWAALDLALARGTRGLPGGSSVAELLARYGIKRNPQRARPLTTKQILTWADAFFNANGVWPDRESGPIAKTYGETWGGIHKALLRGRRGLHGKLSLAAFLNEHRGIYRGKSRRPRRVPESQRLNVDQISKWAAAFQRQTGAWPDRDSGLIPDSGGLKWSTSTRRSSADRAGCRADRRWRQWGKSTVELSQPNQLANRFAPIEHVMRAAARVEQICRSDVGAELAVQCRNLEAGLWGRCPYISNRNVRLR